MAKKPKKNKVEDSKQTTTPFFHTTTTTPFSIPPQQRSFQHANKKKSIQQPLFLMNSDSSASRNYSRPMGQSFDMNYIPYSPPNDSSDAGIILDPQSQRHIVIPTGSSSSTAPAMVMGKPPVINTANPASSESHHPSNVSGTQPVDYIPPPSFKEQHYCYAYIQHNRILPHVGAPEVLFKMIGQVNRLQRMLTTIQIVLLVSALVTLLLAMFCAFMAGVGGALLGYGGYFRHTIPLIVGGVLCPVGLVFTPIFLIVLGVFVGIMRNILSQRSNVIHNVANLFKRKKWIRNFQLQRGEHFVLALEC